MTTFADFQSYYTRKMWRVGDADWATDLPRLVKKAEARINRDLRQTELSTSTVISATANSFTMPADAREISSLSTAASPASAAARAMSPSEYTSMLNQYGSTQRNYDRFFSVTGNTVHYETGATVDAPVSINLSYMMGITPYADYAGVGDSFYDSNPDFYEAALNIEAYEYLKDFDLASIYEAKYVSVLDSMRADSEYHRYPSGQISNRLPGNVL